MCILRLCHHVLSFWSCQLLCFTRLILHFQCFGVEASALKYVQQSSLSVFISLSLTHPILCTGNSKAAEAAGSAYYNPNNPHTVYMPMVSCLSSPQLQLCDSDKRSSWHLCSIFFPFPPQRRGLHHMHLSQTLLTRKPTEAQAPSVQ